MKYRKKPVVVDAIQLNHNNDMEIMDFVGVELERTSTHPTGHPEYQRALVIPTLEGQHIASNGDWIIKGVQGEYYPCKPDIFEATYEEVQE